MIVGRRYIRSKINGNLVNSDMKKKEFKFSCEREESMKKWMGGVYNGWGSDLLWKFIHW